MVAPFFVFLLLSRFSPGVSVFHTSEAQNARMRCRVVQLYFCND